jgi:hypothetical protein
VLPEIFERYGRRGWYRKIIPSDYIIGTPFEIIFTFEADRTQFPGDILIYEPITGVPVPIITLNNPLRVVVGRCVSE